MQEGGGQHGPGCSNVVQNSDAFRGIPIRGIPHLPRLEHMNTNPPHKRFPVSIHSPVFVNIHNFKFTLRSQCPFNDANILFEPAKFPARSPAVATSSPLSLGSSDTSTIIHNYQAHSLNQIPRLHTLYLPLAVVPVIDKTHHPLKIVFWTSLAIPVSSSARTQAMLSSLSHLSVSTGGRRSKLEHARRRLGGGTPSAGVTVITTRVHASVSRWSVDLRLLISPSI